MFDNIQKTSVTTNVKTDVSIDNQQFDKDLILVEIAELVESIKNANEFLKKQKQWRGNRSVRSLFIDKIEELIIKYGLVRKDYENDILFRTHQIMMSAPPDSGGMSIDDMIEHHEFILEQIKITIRQISFCKDSIFRSTIDPDVFELLMDINYFNQFVETNERWQEEARFNDRVSKLEERFSRQSDDACISINGFLYSLPSEKKAKRPWFTKLSIIFVITILIGYVAQNFYKGF